MGMRFKIPRLAQAAKRLRVTVKQAATTLAEHAVVDITDNLKAGLKPDGTAQPQNKTSTREQKRKKGQGNTPGVATGVVSDPSNWRTRASGDRIEILQPPERREAIRHLTRRGYAFEGLPPQTLGRADPLLAKAAREAFSTIPHDEVS